MSEGNCLPLHRKSVSGKPRCTHLHYKKDQIESHLLAVGACAFYGVMLTMMARYQQGCRAINVFGSIEKVTVSYSLRTSNSFHPQG